ncbi:hypothetical protein ACKWTF_013215 [Chironomus riparius]
MSTFAVITILLGFLKLNFGYKPNLFFNFSKLDVSTPYTVITYDVNLTDEIFPMLLGTDYKTKYERIEANSKSQNNFVGTDEIMTIEVGDKIWNFTFDYVLLMKTVCKAEYFVLKADIDDLLTDIFNCRNKVTGYSSRFYVINEFDIQFYSTSTMSQQMYYKRINIFWLISPSDSLFFDMKRNYKVFLRDCNSVPTKVYLLTFGSAVVFIFVLVYASLYWINIRIAFPIIMVEPSGQTAIE